MYPLLKCKLQQYIIVWKIYKYICYTIQFIYFFTIILNMIPQQYRTHKFRVKDYALPKKYVNDFLNDVPYIKPYLRSDGRFNISKWIKPFVNNFNIMNYDLYFGNGNISKSKFYELTGIKKTPKYMKHFWLPSRSLLFAEAYALDNIYIVITNFIKSKKMNKKDAVVHLKIKWYADGEPMYQDFINSTAIEWVTINDFPIDWLNYCASASEVPQDSVELIVCVNSIKELKKKKLYKRK